MAVMMQSSYNFHKLLLQAYMHKKIAKWSYRFCQAQAALTYLLHCPWHAQSSHAKAYVNIALPMHLAAICLLKMLASSNAMQSLALTDTDIEPVCTVWAFHWPRMWRACSPFLLCLLASTRRLCGTYTPCVALSEWGCTPWGWRASCLPAGMHLLTRL